MPLSDRQEKFCLNLVSGMSQTEAYRDAGYSPKGADAASARLSVKISIVERLAELREELKDETIADAREIAQTMTEILRGRITDFVTMGADGAYFDVGPESMNTAALKSVKSATGYDDDGANPEVIKEIVLRCPIAAAKILNKMQGNDAPAKIHATIEYIPPTIVFIEGDNPPGYDPNDYEDAEEGLIEG